MRMKRFLPVISMFILSFSLSCSPNYKIQDTKLTPTSIITPSPTLEPTTSITASPTLAPTENPFVLINLLNDSDRSVCGVYAYSFNQTEEVENLIENEVLIAGDQIQVEIEKGEYIFEIWDCNMNSLFNLYGFQVKESIEWNLSEMPVAYHYEPQQSIILVNQHVLDVCEFYIRSGDSKDWGENLFDQETLYYLPAGSTLLQPTSAGIYDLKLVYCEGIVASVKENYEITLGQNFEWILTQ